MANPRTLRRLESRIKERAAYCLQFEVKDPRAAFVTITKVELATDMARGKIHYSCLGPPADRTKTQFMLESAAGFIQRQVARILATRTVPHLTWHYDDSIEKAAELDRLITQARSRDAEIRPEESDETERASGEEPEGESGD